MTISKYQINNIEALIGQNKHIRFVVAPSLGGKIVSMYNKMCEKEFLWSNKNLVLEKCSPEMEYDINFWGGIDELLPNDIKESVDGNTYPDHGELWTTALEYSIEDEKIIISGRLKQSGLFYKKTMYCKEDSPEIVCEYMIRNESDSVRHFMWKLHAALAIKEGDQLISEAKRAKRVYPENLTNGGTHEFSWPMIGDRNVSLVPAKNNTLDFFYLYGMPTGEMHLLTESRRCLFSYYYDTGVFPYQWYFASYGKFLDHYTVILEPSTCMPVSVKEAMAAGQCTTLEKGQEIKTSVTIYAGVNNKY